MNVSRQFFRYVSQNILGMLGFSCYIIADTYFISKAAGADGITVLNLCLPVYNLIFAIGSLFGVGAATRFAILRAQGDENAAVYFAHSIKLLLLLSIPFVLAGLFGPDAVLRVMGGDDLIVEKGVSYARLFLCFTPFFMCNYVVSAFVRNDDDPMRAMVGTMSGSLFNVLFDYIFMFPMQMGLKGAALATIMAPGVSMLICGTHFLRKRRSVRWVHAPLRLHMGVQSAKLGVSAFVGEFSSGVITTVFNFLILGIAGNLGVAAYGVVANFALVAMSAFNGIAQGSQPLISDYYGKGARKECSLLLKYGVMTSVSLAFLFVAVTYAGTDFLVSLFNSEGDRQLAAFASEGMRLYFPGFVFAGINTVFAGYFSATDRPRESFLVSMLRGFLLIILLAVTMSRLWGFRGVWLSFAAAEGATMLIAACCLIRLQRRRSFE